MDIKHLATNRSISIRCVIPTGGNSEYVRGLFYADANPTIRALGAVLGFGLPRPRG